MSFFDIIDEDPQVIVEFFERFGISLPPLLVERTMNIIALVLLFIMIFGAGKKVYKRWDDLRSFFNRNYKWRREYIKTGLEHSFGDYLLPDRQRCYIPTQSQGTPPHNFEEPDQAVASAPKQELISLFLDEVFTKWNTNRQLYCIFAGSGMGKTTFAVQLFVEYVKRYKKSTLPYDIYIKDLGDAKIMEEIQSLADDLKDKAHHSILILDALDENLKASENFDVFKPELEECITPFKFVVITCRSQFFPNEKEIPDTSSIRQNTPEKNLIRYNKVYIRPFSPDDIDLYIKKKYRGISKKKRKLRKQATGIIQKCRHLMARPVLLSYIDDLIGENKEYTTETEIYETLIEKWLRREVNDNPCQETKEQRYNELMRFSQLLAIKIYQNWRETGEFKLEAQQMNDFCQKNGFEKGNYQFRRRSLVNHDAVGAYKFSHKSFLEFFLAQQSFDGLDFGFSFEGMEMAKLFYQGFCKREYREEQVNNAFKIFSEDQKFFPTGEATLVVAKKTEYEFDHLNYVIRPNIITELELYWNAYNENLQKYIERSDIRTITIYNYEKGVGSIKQLLKAKYLQCILIEGNMPPKTFIKDAEKRGVHVFLNDQTIVQGDNPFSSSSLKMQVALQMEKQLRSIELSRLQMGRNYIDDILNTESEKKGGLK